MFKKKKIERRKQNPLLAHYLETTSVNICWSDYWHFILRRVVLLAF